MRASRQASRYRPAHSSACSSTSVSTPAAGRVSAATTSRSTTTTLAASAVVSSSSHAVSSSCTAQSSSSAALMSARRFTSTDSTSTTATEGSAAAAPKYDEALWGRLLKKFLAENSLQQYEQEEFLVRRGWFEELFQGFDLLDALPSNERDEILAHQLAIQKEIEAQGPPSEEELKAREAEPSCCEFTDAKDLAMPKFQLRMPPHVLMFGSSVVGTAFKFGDVDFGSVFPACESLGRKINEMRDRELEKLYAEFDEVERLRHQEIMANNGVDIKSDSAEAGSFVREHRGPQVLPLLGRATVAGMMYVPEAGYVLVHRQIQPQVLAAIYEYIMTKQADAEREAISEVLKKNTELPEPAVLQVANAPSECIASSIDPLMQLGAFEEEMTPAEKILKDDAAIAAAKVAAERLVAEEAEMTEEEKADRKLKRELLGLMTPTSTSGAASAGDSKIGQVLAGLTPEAIAANAAAKSGGSEVDDIMTNKKLGTVALGGMETHLIVHRIFRARVPIMQFSPPSEDGAHNKPQAQTLFDGLDAEQVSKEDQAAGKTNTATSTPDADLVDRLVTADMKSTTATTSTSAATTTTTTPAAADATDGKVNLTSETFSRFFAAGDAAKSGKSSRFTKRLPAKPMQIGSTMGVTSLMDRGQFENEATPIPEAQDGTDIPKTAYFDPKTETTEEKRKRYRADAFHDARVSTSFGGSLSDIPTEQEIADKKDPKLAASLSRDDDSKTPIGDGKAGSKNSSENLFKNMTSVIYKKKEHYDLSLAISGVQNSLLLRHYMERDPELRAAALMLKYWGRKRRLLNARRGWISPYALSIMFVHYYVESQKLVAEKLKAEGKPLRKDRIYNYVCTTHVFPALKEVSARFLRHDKGIISTREPIHHRYFRKSKEFQESVGETGKLASVLGGKEMEPGTAVEDLRGKDGKLYFPPSPQGYGLKMFDVSLYSYDDLLTNPLAVTETISYPIEEPSREEKERIWFEAVPRHLEGFFKYFSDETQFDFDKDIVDIRSELPEERKAEKKTALSRIQALEACTCPNEFARLSEEFRQFKIAEAAASNDEIRCKSKHAPVFTSYTSFTPHSWRDFRYDTRDDWYNSLKDEGVIQIVPGVSGVLNPYNGQKSHPTSSYFNSPNNGTMEIASAHDKLMNTLKETSHELWRMGLPRTNERWHRLGHEMLMIRDPYELHSLGRGTEFFRAEVIREEIRGAVEMKAGGLDDVEEFLKSL